MKKLLLISILGLAITSCVHDPMSSSREGVDIKVDLLFEKDGIKMYRFLITVIITTTQIVVRQYLPNNPEKQLIKKI